jgi:hypothetical protein
VVHKSISMVNRGISSFSGQSFHLASVLGRGSMANQTSQAKGGDEDGLAHMHLDSVTLSSNVASQSAAFQSSAVSSSLTDQGEDDGEAAEGDSDGVEGESGSAGAPTFLLADGTPGIEGMGDGDDDGGGDDGGGDGD